MLYYRKCSVDHRIYQARYGQELLDGPKLTTLPEYLVMEYGLRKDGWVLCSEIDTEEDNEIGDDEDDDDWEMISKT